MSRRSRSKPQNDIPSTQEENEDIDEDSEVTRCVCGHEELLQPVNSGLSSLLAAEYSIKIDVGLFIQCDKCSVWQHGYCVGLFVDADVPDKYWCEMCRPENHIAVADDPPRTLYKSVNEKRRSLIDWSLDRRRSKRLTDQKRKERRHDDYDEQLKRALRELARESGVVLSDTDSRSTNSRQQKAEEAEPMVKSGNSSHSSPENNGHGPRGRGGSGNTNGNAEGTKRKREVSRTPQPDVLLPKKLHSGDLDSVELLLAPTSVPSLRTKPKKSSNKARQAAEAALLKEELTSQALKPRYVNPKLLLYELRKRTGAILEWLGRSQIELEEEKESKVQLFRYEDGTAVSLREKDVALKYDQNLALVASLTENILKWEEKYGKYAP